MDGLTPRLGTATWRGYEGQGSYVQGVVLTSFTALFLHLGRGIYSAVEQLPGMYEVLG